MKKLFDAFQLFNPNILAIFLILVGFVFLDYFWLNSLSKWGISYGSVKWTTVLFTFLRCVFFILWVIIQIFASINKLHVHYLSIGSFLIPNLLLLAFGIYGFCIEPFTLTTSRIQVAVPGLESPVRIVQLSDIHVEFTTKREKDLPGYVANLQPDMIVITGDSISETYVNNPNSIRDLGELIGQLSAPLGIYAVNGNVDTPQKVQMMFRGLDVNVLQDQVVRLPEIAPNFVLIGLDYFDLDIDKEELQTLMAQTKTEDFTLLLYHKPDLIYTAADLGVNLYLAGHTHGGQVRLPFYGALFTNSMFGKKFEMGLYHVKNTTLFVSRGLGFTGGIAPAIRFLAPPEVVVIDLVPE